MKVGIMSMQRIINYGSFLQSYSLKKTIESLGHEVEFVDYNPGPVLIKTKKSFIRILYRRMKKSLLFLTKKRAEKMTSDAKAYYKYENIFRKEILPLMGVGEKRNLKPEIDILVIGSDEVFNCLQTNPDVGYSKELFGYGTNADRVISYAASFGNTTFDNLVKYGIVDEITGFLKGFYHISVRDNNSERIIRTIGIDKVDKHVDPVFLYDYTSLIPSKKMGSDYIAIYAYWSRISKSEAQAIKEFANKHNKKIICLCAPQEHLENFIAATPFEILAYIRDADYIVTDTFHGTVFSIKYNKNFSVFLRQGHENIYGNNEKLHDLLIHFGLTSRIVDENRTLDSILSSLPQFEEINDKINNERNRSIAYLEKMIEG